MNVFYQPLVSVIVPVYKVEDVLARCLDSLCRQSLQDIEIILVDDASPDRCGKICEQYAARDERFRVIHHSENRGLSVARNTGIAHASAVISCLCVRSRIKCCYHRAETIRLNSRSSQMGSKKPESVVPDTGLRKWFCS